MKSNILVKIELALITVLLMALAMRSVIVPGAANAQSLELSRSIYIEPGVRMLRAPDGSKQLLGKVVVDLTNGNVWGFPTTVEQPYPVDMTKSEPPVSKPFLLGKFDFSKMVPQQ